jgi:hypothetical protein
MDDDHIPGLQGFGPRIASPMLNFFLGTVAGGLIACVLTITAARQPEVQARLGFKPPPVTLAAATKPAEPNCERHAEPTPRVGTQDMLFNRQRFWSVAP